MSLNQLSQRMQEILEESAPTFNANRAEVERLIDAMLGGSQVPAKAQAVVGREGDVAGLLDELRVALYPVVVHTVQKLGGKVSGATGVQAALRGMAREDREPTPTPGIDLD